MVNARWCNYTDVGCRTCFLQFVKGGHTATQNRTRKNTRGSHILRVRNTHMFGTRRFGVGHKVHSSSRSSILRAMLTRARRRGRRSGRRTEGGGNSVARALIALVLPLGPVLPLPDRMLMPGWRGSRRISSDFLRVRLRHCHLHLLRCPGG